MTLEEQLLRDEGLRLKPYVDTAGKLTIGVGRNLTDVGITKDEAMVLLQNDIAEKQTELYQALPWSAPLDGVRLGALLNMAFNLGISGLLGFRQMLAAVEAGDYAAASLAMTDSEWAKQVGDRAERLAKQMLTGEWV